MDLNVVRYTVKAISGYPLTRYSRKWRLRGMNGSRVFGQLDEIDTWIPVLWEGDGPPYLLNFIGPDGVPRGFLQCCGVPFGMSSDGTMVGIWSDTRFPQDGWQGFIRRPNGSAIYLGSIIETEQSSLLCISDSGLKAAGGTGPPRGHGIGPATILFSFDVSTHSVVRHGIDINWSLPVRINNAGDIVGNAHPGNGFLLKDGLYTDLGAGISAVRITNSGLIAGNAPSGAWIAHSSRPLEVQTLIPGFHLNDLSEDGKVAVGDGPGGASIWMASQGLESLNALQERFSPWYLASARYIDSAGWIVGEGDQLGVGTLNFIAKPYPTKIHIKDPLIPDLLWPRWLELPQALPPLEGVSLDLIRAVMVNQLGRTMLDDTSRKVIREASVKAIEQALDRLRREP